MLPYNEWLDASVIDDIDAGRVACPNADVVWNGDYSQFRLVRLLWWDDASYARYQGGE